MLPTPEISVWSSSARLTSVCRRRSAAENASSSKSGSSGSRAMCAIRGGHAASASGQLVDGEPAEGALVDEAQLAAAVGEGEPDPQVRLVGLRRAARPAAGRSCRGAPTSAVPVGAPSGSAAAATGTCRAGGRRRASGRSARRRSRSAPGEVPAHGARVEHLDGGDGAAGDPALQAAPDDLDLGQLRHRSAPGRGPAGRRVGLAARTGACQAASAASCSASFLRAAAAGAVHLAGQHDRGGEGLRVVGAVVARPGSSGTPRPRAAVELLQAGLPVQAGAAGRGDCASSGSNSRCTIAAGRVQAVPR